MDKPRKIHESVTTERVMEALESDLTTLNDTGFCIACGTEHTGVEPDARDYPCENDDCGEHAVYGAEELLFMIK